MTSQTNRLHGSAREDLERKYTSVLIFDLEAAARLKSWSSLDDIIQECAGHGDLKTWGNVADIILGCDAPEHIKIDALQKLLPLTSRLSPPMTLASVSRWIRCLYALALPSNTDVAQHVLNQVISSVIVGPTAISSTEATPRPDEYPAEELEYLATTAYNQAIDFYSVGAEAGNLKSHTWAALAIRLAELLKELQDGDNGALLDLLQERWSALRWGD